MCVCVCYLSVQYYITYTSSVREREREVRPRPTSKQVRRQGGPCIVRRTVQDTRVAFEGRFAWITSTFKPKKESV